MLAHFLKRDFRDFQIWWAVLGVLTVGVVVASLLLPWLPVLMMLLWAYMMFAFSAVHHVLGSVWRTQHQASRYYLLSLPLSHKKLFAIQHARLAVFWLPLIALGSLGPRWEGPESLFFSLFSNADWAFYYFGLFTSVALLIEDNVRSTLETERIASYVPRGQRAWAWTYTFTLTFGALGLLGIAWHDLLLHSPALTGVKTFRPFGLSYWEGSWRILFPLGLVLAALEARWNARRWCVTL